MSEQVNEGTRLSSIAERSNASGEWWKDVEPQRSDLELPTRVLVALENAGITTVEQLKAAGPSRLRKIDHIGKQAFDQIVALLRALDHEKNGGTNGGTNGGG